MKWLDKLIVSERGLWDNPNEPVVVPTKSGNITMKADPKTGKEIEGPVFAIDNTGYSQMMYPGGEYQFPGNMVYEVPMAYGGDISIPDLSRPNWLDKAQKGKQVKYYDDYSEYLKAAKAEADSSLAYQRDKKAYESVMNVTAGSAFPYEEILKLVDSNEQFYGNRTPGYSPKPKVKPKLDQQAVMRKIFKSYPGYSIKFENDKIFIREPETEAEMDSGVRKLWKPLPTEKKNIKPEIKKLSYKEDRLKMSDKGLAPITYMPLNNTAAVLSKIKEEDMYRQASKVVPAPEFQKGGLATRADSLEVLNNTKQLEDYYRSYTFRQSMPVEKNDNWLNLLNDLRVGFNESDVRRTPEGQRKVSLDEYYKPVDANRFYQREIGDVVLDTRAPVSLFDKRIRPQQVMSVAKNDPKDVLHGDYVSIYKYDPLAITPWDMLSDADKKLRVQKYGVPEVAIPKRPPVPKNIKSKEAILEAPEDRLIREYNTLVPNEDYKRVYDKSPYSIKEYGQQGKPTHWAKQDEKIPGVWRPIKETPSNLFVSKKVKFNTGGWLEKYQKGKEVKEETYRTPWWNPEKPSEWNPAWTSDPIRQNAQAEFLGSYVLPTVEVTGEKPQRFKDQEAAAATARQNLPDKNILDISNIQDPTKMYDEFIDNSRNTRNAKYNDTLIDITDRPMGWFGFNTIPGQTYTEILGNNYIEVDRDATGKPEDYAKNWKTRMQDSKDIFRNPDYAQDAGSYYHSKDIPAFYGIENGKFKVGKPDDFKDDTVIVPVRNSTTPYSKVEVEKGLIKDNMYTYDKEGNKTWNLRNKQKFFVHSPVTKKTVFMSKDSKDDMNSPESFEFTKKSLEEFSKNNPEAYIIPLDEGRYRAYMSSPEGLDDESFKTWNAFSGTILANYLRGIKEGVPEYTGSSLFKAGPPVYSPAGDQKFGYNIGLLKQKHGGWLEQYQEGSQVKANIPGFNPEVGPTVKNAQLLQEQKLQEAVRNSRQLPSGAIQPTLGPIEYMLLPGLAGSAIKKAMEPKAHVDTELEAIRKILRKNVTYPKQTGPLTETPPWPNRFLELGDDAWTIGNMESGRTSVENPNISLPGNLPKRTPKQLPGVNGTQYPNRLPKQKNGGWLDNY